jgi:hypothetical protein
VAGPVCSSSWNSITIEGAISGVDGTAAKIIEEVLHRRRGLRREGLSLIRFHDLRDTAATRMLSAIGNPKVVSEILGHSSVAITLDRNSQVMPTVEAAGVRRRGAARTFEGTKEGTAAPEKPDSCSESGVDETWYRIPDSR